MTRNTLTLFGNAKAVQAKRRIDDDPMAGLTPVEKAMAQRMASTRP